jgi:hypothetical protein
MEWLKEFLEDKSKIRNLRLGIAIFLALGLGILYFGFFSQLSLALIFTLSVGILGIIAYISYLIIWWEIGEYAFEIECEDNNNITTETKILHTEIKKVNEDVAIIFIDDYNDKNQKIANVKLTTKTIYDLDKQIRKKKFKKEDYSELTYKRQFLLDNPLFNNKYKPIQYDDVISVSGKSGNSEYQSTEIGYNPKTDGIKIAFLFGLLKMAGLGLNAAVPFIIKDWKALLTFYAILIVSLTVMATKRYFKVRYKTSTKYLDNIRNQVRLLEEINSQPIPKQEDIEEDSYIKYKEFVYSGVINGVVMFKCDDDVMEFTQDEYEAKGRPVAIKQPYYDTETEEKK